MNPLIYFTYYGGDRVNIMSLSKYIDSDKSPPVKLTLIHISKNNNYQRKKSYFSDIQRCTIQEP